MEVPERYLLEASEKLSKMMSEASDYTDYLRLHRFLSSSFNLCNLFFNRCNQRALHIFRLFQSSLLKQQDSKFKSLKGFTLLEMVISIAIMVLVVTAASVIFNQTLVVYRYSTSKIIVAQEAQIAMKWIADDIQSESATDIIVPMDPEGNVIHDEITIVVAGINIHYYMDNTDPQNIIIQRAEGVTPSLLAENVVGLNFEYYGINNNVLGNPSAEPDKTNLRIIEIDIRTQRNNQAFHLNSVARYGPNIP